MTNLKNSLNGLTWNVPIVDGSGLPSQEFMKKWAQQASTNAKIPDLTTAAAVSTTLDLLGAVRGDLLYRGAAQWGPLAPGVSGKFMQTAGAGADPTWAVVKDSDVVFTNITTNDVSITKHGYAPILPNDATKYLNGTGAYTVPVGGVTSVALSLDAGIYTVTGSPVTGTGTLTGTLNTQSANTVFSGPTTGAAAKPAFRAIVAADLPLATTSAFGAVKPDGTTITIAAGLISAVGGSGVAAEWNVYDGAMGLFYIHPDGRTITGLYNGGPTGTPWRSLRSGVSRASGKYYFEFLVSVVGDTYSPMIGVGTSAATLSNFVGFDTLGWGVTASGLIFHNNVSVANLAYVAGDIMGVAVDFTASTGSIKFYKNNVVQTTTFTSLTLGTMYPMGSMNGGTGSPKGTLCLKAAEQTYTPPTGYSSWS